ncbi:MAG: hypothetical protein PHI66_02105 [Candidatus Pacebacteria bacterium]|nr:hypothetical protein [Candidatus Paceibacterota bacterium]
MSEKDPLGEWGATVLGDINWGFENLPKDSKSLVLSGKFVRVCLTVLNLYVTGWSGSLICVDSGQSPEEKISVEHIAKIARIRTVFIQTILKKIEDPNFFYRPGFYLERNYRKVFPVPEWMVGTIFEEVGTIFQEFILPNGIEDRSKEYFENPKWNFQMEVVDYLKKAYAEEIERQEQENGSSEPILELRLGLIESLFQCLKEEEELEQGTRMKKK